MEAAQRPRGECPIVKLTRESRGGWGTPSRTAAGVGGGVEGGTGAGAGALAVAAAGGVLDEGGVAAADTSAAAAAVVREEGGGDGRLRFGMILMCDEGMWPEE